MTQTSDSIIQFKICPVSGNEFSITQWDLDFYDKISPTFAGQKFQIPTPILCPDERQRRRLAFRNERHLYRRTCDASGKQIISIYSPDKPYKVYDQKVRRSDSRDAMDYGRDFDFSKTFTENFRELLHNVPLPSQFNTNWENSDYCNHVGDMKNCYLCSASRGCEDTMYGSKVFTVKDSIDILSSSNIEHCYQIINCELCYDSICLIDSSECTHSMFLINCRGCDHCFMSHWLENKKYVYYNQQLDKVEYEEKMQNIQKKVSYDWDYFTQYRIIISNYRDAMIISCEDCSGHRITNSKNCFECYNILNAKDCKFIGNGKDCENVYDGFGVGYGQNLWYEIIDTGVHSYKNLFTMVSHGNRDVSYILTCSNSENLFWCIGLRNKSYCIFNKQYTKEEYEKLVAKIIIHMKETGERGEFFHPSLSPFGYNETVAQEYYPLEKADSLLKWYCRSDYESPKPASDKVIQWKNLPDSIDEVQDDILQYAIACEVTGKLFRIQPQELVFYRKHHIPLPRKHPDQRHLERLVLRR